MTLEELVRRFRVLAQDKVEPFLFETEDVHDWLSDAEAQAAVRGRLLLEDMLAGVCMVPVAAGIHTYKLHAKLYELVTLRFKPEGQSRATPLKMVSREWLDSNVQDWRDQEGSVRYALQNETSIRVVGVPDQAGLLLIEGYRLPLKPLANDSDRPEIHEASHEKLIQWALYRAFGMPDAETFDPARSAKAEAEFTAYFGLSPDSDLRRITREDVEHCNHVYVP